MFCAMAECYQDMIYRIALNYSGSPQDAEDIVQEALTKLYLREEPFQNDSHVRAWLIRVTVNLCKNTLRSPWRRRRVPLDALKETAVFAEPGQSELFLALMGLPEKYRTVLYLFYYEECSVREIASLLSVKESTVTTRLQRARQALRKVWTEVLEHE